MKYIVDTTPNFDKWLGKLKDKSTKQKIMSRLARIENGSFGDYKRIANDLFELRFFFSGGLRIYYTVRNNQIVILLVGGNKSSQKRDIDKAKEILNKLE